MALWSATQCCDCLRRDGFTCVLPACLPCHYRSVGCVPPLCLQGRLLLCAVSHFPEPADDSGQRDGGNKGTEIKGNHLLAALAARLCGRRPVSCSSAGNAFKTSKQIVMSKNCAALEHRCRRLASFLNMATVGGDKKNRPNGQI